MAQGTVKWFDPKKGFGFIINEKGQDVFVHYTCINGDGFRCLRNGQVVEYEEFTSDKGLQGQDVKILELKATTPTKTPAGAKSGRGRGK
ncbi:MAG: cold shock domain-containing protein [Sedimentisphaerales bacterium]|nr:cold shock domain-containing protein [Sedimentisphaerales bacterium]